MISKTSRMSGASNFDEVLHRLSRPPAAKSRKSLQMGSEAKAENELEFLQDENQWASIYKYNNYLQQKKEMIVKLKVMR